MPCCCMRRVLKVIRQALFGLRSRLLLLIALACAPLLFWTLYTAWEERGRVLANWQARSRTLAERAARQEQRLIEDTHQMLQVLALAETFPLRAGNLKRCKKLVEDFFATHPQYADLGVIDAKGVVVVNAALSAAPPSPAEQEFFTRVLARTSFTVGELPLGGVATKATVKFGYPISDQSGQVWGAVFATYDPGCESPFGSEPPATFPRQATWTELARDGSIVSRYPLDRDWADEHMPEAIVNTALSQRQGLIEATPPQGSRTFYAFAFTRSEFVPGNIVGVLSVPKSVLYAAPDEALAHNLKRLAIAICGALALGWVWSNLLVVGRVKALVDASERLAEGDLSARTGLRNRSDELGRLTLAFDRMAENFEQREHERHGATQKVQILSQRVVEVQETERRKIARELHDEIGQTLTVAEVSLQDALKDRDKVKLEQRLERSIKAVERVLEQVHDLSLNLRPSMLDDLGLEPALRWYIRRQAELVGLKTQFHAEPLEQRLDPIISPDQCGAPLAGQPRCGGTEQEGRFSSFDRPR
ncbi:MAG: hypothetical protein DME25_05160 [Verrucomicrobia bacterium]|nr:MAG: hypothetical protein DME25_05160 [Verrucomicrobiota bacterium]